MYLFYYKPEWVDHLSGAAGLLRVSHAKTGWIGWPWRFGRSKQADQLLWVRRAA